MLIRPNLLVPHRGEKAGACLGVHSLPWGWGQAGCRVLPVQSCLEGVMELQEHRGSQGGACSWAAAHDFALITYLLCPDVPAGTTTSALSPAHLYPHANFAQKPGASSLVAACGWRCCSTVLQGATG